MSHTSQKIGFKELAALVIGGQVGVGILLLPAALAAYGSLGLAGWLVSSAGAITLALIFAQLCRHIPKAGGPNTYVRQAFGDTAAFFTGWVYWLVAWTSNIAVVLAAVSYLSPIFGHLSKTHNLMLEIAIVSLLTLINIRGPKLVGKIELVLTILKCLPLIILPIGGIMYFNMDNFYPVNPTNFSTAEVLTKTALLTFWGFIGLESATANAEIVENPTKTVPKAVLFGTILVALFYILNSISVMAIVSQGALVASSAPYVDAAQKIFGNNIEVLASIIIAFACIGTLNAWILTSGQIAFGAAKDGLFPAFCGKVNRYDAPYISLIISFIGTIILLFLTLSDNIVTQLTMVIDFSVITFLFVYLICMLAFLKMFGHRHKIYGFISILGGGFCLWVIGNSPILYSIVSLAFVLSGIPVYLWNRKQNIQSTKK
jgi:APA family basic amino acid/polyamine antiporter